MNFRYDIIVVGGGHAGCEAAHAAAKMGMRTVLVTMDMTKLGEMSCNPAMGGIAKGQIIREIDAMGGMSGLVTDKSIIQFRMLNRSKGPAMWSPRAQCDRALFSRTWREALERTGNLFIWQEQATKLLVEKGKVKGVETTFGTVFNANAVILASGTFLNGIMHVGYSTAEGGRSGDETSKGISEQLRGLGFEVERMKTGTSARLDGRSIDFSKMTEQKGDGEGRCFSYLNDKIEIADERSCYIVHTNEKVHDELRKGLKFSPLFQGRIKGIGPRYCPSIEDKIVKFKDKNAHQLFIEPEGWNTVEYYINGFSSSLPLETQLNALRKIDGLENVNIFRPGYAIEYDFFQPTQLKSTLETRKIEGLYFAGQINGTTGYEEAGAQGMMAGINAVLRLRGEEPLVFQRDESYIGVLIDDLVTKGVDEPYRMFTSRAEYRILLRQDNADERLTMIGYRIGLAESERIKKVEEKKRRIKEIYDYVRNESLEPDEINEYLESRETSKIKQRVKAITLASRPQVRLIEILEKCAKGKEMVDSAGETGDQVVEGAEIIIKYQGYIEREKSMAERIKRLDNLRIPGDINYEELKSISTEGRQKLEKHKPETIGMASRTTGVSPSDIGVLLMYIGR